MPVSRCEESSRNILYIIGNGFDLHHKLKTAYADFGKFLELDQRYTQIYDAINQYLGYECSDDSVWNRLEENLACLDFEEVLEELRDYIPSIGDDDYNSCIGSYEIEIQRVVGNLTTDLVLALREFILKIEFQTQIISQKAVNFVRNSTFLSFNYTDTLEQYYQIDPSKILYIHGKARSERGQLILGHAISPNSPFFSEQIDQKEPTNEDEYNYSYQLGLESIRDYANKSFKPSQKIIEQNKSFFDNLKEVHHVVVLGHSLSAVDEPYFQKIVRDLNPTTNYIVSFYNEEELESHRNFLTSLGISENNIDLIEGIDNAAVVCGAKLGLQRF